MVKILFDDDYITVAEKPAGMTSEISDSKSSFPAELAKTVSSPSLFPVHRLDRETSGLMVYAKTAYAAAELSEQIRNGIFKKEYIAAVSPAMESDSGELVDMLYFDRRQNKAFSVTSVRKGVRKAVLSYRTEAKFGNLSVLHIELRTGRTHQIRVQFSHRGHSVVGDRRYGSKIKTGDMLLWSYRLSFLHPLTKEALSFSDSPPWRFPLINPDYN